MLLPVVPAGLDPAVATPPSTETEHESTELWAAQTEEQKKAKNDSIITKDPPQLKNPPELGMLPPVVQAGFDPVVVIPLPQRLNMKV